MKRWLSAAVCAAILCATICFCFSAQATDVVSAADAISGDTLTDAADALQALIDANPNRTIYFPDGVYLLSHPICTPANPRKSVELRLSNYAVLRASSDFSGEALVRLGAKDPANDTSTPGSNYALTGGVLDGSGVTGGITVEGGRETAIRETSIKNAIVGIHIFYGANSGSSDADVRDVNIIGTGGTDSVGIFVEGYDNTFTNIRIGHVFVGMHLRSSANALRNIHPLYYSDYTDYENSCAFLDETGSNVYDFCYSDQFCVGFRTIGNVSNIYSNCFCYWYSAAGGREVGFRADGKFRSVVTNARLSFRSDTNNAVLQTSRFFGNGTFDNLLVESSHVRDKSYLRFMRGSIFRLWNILFG